MKKALPFIVGLLSFVANAQVPANDECSNAQVITVGSSSASGTMAQATNSTIPDCPGTTSYSDVWYQFTATSDMHYVIVNTTTINARLLVSLFNEDCANLLPIKCNGTTSFYTDNLIVGEEYKIRVYTIYDNPTNLSANFTLSVSTLTTPINPITITDTQYTPEQLVTDIFFNSGCVEVTNITSSTGTDFGNVNGIGYFESNDVDFNLESGIMLSSGSVLNAPGPYVSGNAGMGEVSGSQAWQGDDDVEIFTGVPNSYNATILEFDFVAEADNFSFDFLFASREYGPMMCFNSDSMAILLTDTETGTTTNLAVIPGTTTPVRSIVIRPDVEGAPCGPINSQYFDQLYTDNAAITAPINFAGITVPIQASASIIPGNQYHLKIAIVDNFDPSFASAIFFGPANFDLPELDAEITSSTGYFMCSGQPTTLSIDVDDSLYSIQWYLNDIAIQEATGSSYTATQGGVYSVSTSLVPGSSCGYTFEYALEEIDVNPADISDYIIVEEESDGFATFDLSLKAEDILSQNGYDSSEYNVSFSLVQGGTELPAVYTNTTNPQTVYVNIEHMESGCTYAQTILLQVIDEAAIPPAPDGAEDQNFTQGETLANLEVTGENIQWYDGMGPDSTNNTMEEPLPITTALIDGTTYFASQTINNIESIGRLAVTVHLIMDTQEQTFTGLQYYPNPVTNTLTISNTNTLDNIAVYNFLGQMVLSKNISAQTAEINLSSLTTGLYTVKVNSAGQSKTIKIQKN